MKEAKTSAEREMIYQPDMPAGITELSKEFFEREKDRHGRVLQVRVYDDGNDTTTYVICEDADLVMDGFGIGYTGEGSRGLQWLLDQVGAEYSNSDIYWSYPSFAQKSEKKHWKFDVPNIAQPYILVEHDGHHGETKLTPLGACTGKQEAMKKAREIQKSRSQHFDETSRIFRVLVDGSMEDIRYGTCSGIEPVAYEVGHTVSVYVE